MLHYIYTYLHHLWSPLPLASIFNFICRNVTIPFIDQRNERNSCKYRGFTVLASVYQMRYENNELSYRIASTGKYYYNESFDSLHSRSLTCLERLKYAK